MITINTLKHNVLIRYITAVAVVTLFAALLIPLSCQKVYAEETDNISGVFRGVPWELTIQGYDYDQYEDAPAYYMLSIGEEGKEYSFDSDGGIQWPWKEYGNAIRSVRVAGKVKGKGSCKRMFKYLYNLNSVDMSGFDTSDVTDMSGMFAECGSLTSIDLSGWDTSKVTDMSYMFQNCRSLKSIDLSDWDASSVTAMDSMFRYCRSLKSIDLSDWDASSVISMKHTFWNCRSLEKADLSGISIAGGADLNYLFSGCTNLRQLDISSMDTSKANTQGMLKECTFLYKIALGKKTRFKSVPKEIGKGWKRVKTLTGKKVSKPGIDELIDYDGTAPGWYECTALAPPKGTAISKTSGLKKGAKVYWKKQTKQTKGYQIQVATNRKFTKNVKLINVKKKTQTSKKITGLKSKKKYYFRIRTYKVKNDKKLFSDWSKAKYVKTK